MKKEILEKGNLLVKNIKIIKEWLHDTTRALNRITEINYHDEKSITVLIDSLDRGNNYSIVKFSSKELITALEIRQMKYQEQLNELESELDGL